MKANLLGAATLVMGTLGLSACGDQRMIPPPPQTGVPTPPPRPATPPSAPAPQGWADYPATPGDWRWSQEDGQSVARFAGGRLVLRCTAPGRTLRLERTEAGRAPSAPAAMRIITQTQTRAVTAVPSGAALVVDLPPRDGLLDAMAFSKGRFAIETNGLPTLYVPSWTEVSRVVEDCR